MSTTIRLGISTCPNDTFAFAALMNRRVDLRGLEFEIELLDIQQLNERLFRGDFDVAKTSFHAALLLTRETIVLPSGSALGFGVGPLLLSAVPGDRPTDPASKTLSPGRHTTAALLLKLFYPDLLAVEHVVFSDIMPRLKQRQADFGVCIHEGRFTWQNEGLGLVEDLGERWEAQTGCPLPLGGLVARRRLPQEMIAKSQAVIRESLQHALADPDTALPTMRRYAQEFSDDVLMKHVELYVNEWTTDLGADGRQSLETLSALARAAEVIDDQAPPISVFRP